MQITIIFATYNGSYTLPRMLDCYYQLNIPESITWQIIAVDNNSTDNSVEILKSYQDKLPLKVLQEIKPGKNSALNKALKEELGELIIFTDDDVLPDSNWLSSYEQLALSQPNFHLFGGPIMPHWEASPPKGLIEGIPTHVAFALTADNTISQKVKAGKIFGPNMAVRIEVFDSGMIFNDSIGPNGTNYVMGSETDFLQRAEQEGYHAYFSKTVIVEHIIRPWQFNKKWLQQRAFKFGRAIVHNQLRVKELEQHNLLFGYPKWGFRKVAELWMTRMVTQFKKEPNNKYSADWDYYMNLGFLSEYKKIQR